MSGNIIVIDGKKYDRTKFEPRARRCSHCPLIGETQPWQDDVVMCKLFGWSISRQLSKRDAVCSRQTKALSFSVTLSDAQVTQEHKQNIPKECV